LPGHPRMDKVPQDPHLTAQQWQALLDRGIAEMERLMSRYRADGFNYLDNLPKELLPGLYYLGNLSLSALYCVNTPKGLVFINAPVGTLLVDALAARVQAQKLNERQPWVILLTSVDAESTAGLPTLLQQRSDTIVVAPRAGVEKVRQI